MYIYTYLCMYYCVTVLRGSFGGGGGIFNFCPPFIFLLNEVLILWWYSYLQVRFNQPVKFESVGVPGHFLHCSSKPYGRSLWVVPDRYAHVCMQCKLAYIGFHTRRSKSGT